MGKSNRHEFGAKPNTEPNYRKMTHYQVLGLDENASHAQLVDRLKTLDAQHETALNAGEPGRSEQAFKAQRAAWQELGDPQRKEDYDECLTVVKENTKNKAAHDSISKVKGTLLQARTATKEANNPDNGAQERGEHKEEAQRLLTQADAEIKVAHENIQELDSGPSDNEELASSTTSESAPYRRL